MLNLVRSRKTFYIPRGKGKNKTSKPVFGNQEGKKQGFSKRLLILQVER